ncbi:MAG: PEGA domain-containing protein [Deltaproteobacteria bacterium]|nr:MAG: PEGA domain-containing protein [Deltaproteobacteria bacterium]
MTARSSGPYPRASPIPSPWRTYTSPPLDEALAPFQTESFGRYYLVDKVATGGMAEVFKAKSFSHGGFEKLLVIKRILEHLSDNEEFVEMFIDEAKITVSLQHPNIVQIYDFGRINDNYYLSMECVEGKDVKGILRKLAQRRKLLPTEFAVYIAHEMAKGLYYAHTKVDSEGRPLRIIHRDISPSNILVSYTGEVKIADFGIAKAESSAYDTQDGVLKGKFEYMSPEQASGAELDHRSDIFSAGIILHEMLTGRRLFKTDSDVKTLEKIKAVDILPPSALNPNVPARLDDIVMKALARDPDDRFQDARELQQALLEFSYPATPDLTRESLAHFMQELFAQEIEDERARLAEGTRVAAEMYAAEPHPDDGDWQMAATTASGTLATRPSRWPLLVALVAVIVLAGALVVVLTREPHPPPPEQPEQPTTASLQLRILPPDAQATIYLDDQQIGTGTELLKEGLPPGRSVKLRVVAEGYREWSDTVDLVAGERLRQQVRLDPIVEPTPDDSEPTEGSGAADAAVVTPPVPAESPPAEPSAPQVVVEPVSVDARFVSDPPGAVVLVDGRRVGTTPLTWTDGTPGRSYSVRYELDGYEPVEFSARLPSSGSRTFSQTLAKKEVLPGKLSVFSSKPGTVFVDGQEWGVTPPMQTREVKPGTHSIRIEHTDGSVSEGSKEVAPGAKERATF